MLIKTGLYVITGGPGTGKTSLIEELKIVGYQTVKEVARDIIKEQQQQGGDALPWKDTVLYTSMMLERSVDHIWLIKKMKAYYFLTEESLIHWHMQG